MTPPQSLCHNPIPAHTCEETLFISQLSPLAVSTAVDDKKIVKLSAILQSVHDVSINVTFLRCRAHDGEYKWSRFIKCIKWTTRIH